MVNDLISKGALIAQVFDINSMNGINFPTPESATFQFGFGHISENKVLIPHIHKRFLFYFCKFTTKQSNF